MTASKEAMAAANQILDVFESRNQRITSDEIRDIIDRAFAQRESARVAAVEALKKIANGSVGADSDAANIHQAINSGNRQQFHEAMWCWSQKIASAALALNAKLEAP